MMDIILERASKGLCPICVKKLGTDFKRVEYKGEKIWICDHHPSPEDDLGEQDEHKNNS